MMYLPKQLLLKKLLEIVEEDLGEGDITTYLLIPKNTKAEAEVLAKEGGVFAGLEEALTLCDFLNLEAEALESDGAHIGPKTSLIRIKGDARTILSVERTLLNLLSRMSGIATATNRIVSKARQAGYKVRVASTRKVAPGLGYFDKKAVLVGGGDTHRFRLDDLILIKDNHIAITRNVEEAVKKARETASFSKKIEVEVQSVKQALAATRAGADIIMLDNFSPAKVKETVTALTKKGNRNRVLIEVSGRIHESNILDYAEAQVDVVSVGAITHSVKSLDMSLEFTKIFDTAKNAD